MFRLNSGVMPLLHPGNKFNLAFFIMGLLHISKHLFEPPLDQLATFLVIRIPAVAILVFVGLGKTKHSWF